MDLHQPNPYLNQSQRFSNQAPNQQAQVQPGAPTYDNPPSSTSFTPYNPQSQPAKYSYNTQQSPSSEPSSQSGNKCKQCCHSCCSSLDSCCRSQECQCVVTCCLLCTQILQLIEMCAFCCRWATGSDWLTGLFILASFYHYCMDAFLWDILTILLRILATKI